MNTANDIIGMSEDRKNNGGFSEMNLENSNRLALSTVQTTLMRQTSNGC